MRILTVLLFASLCHGQALFRAQNVSAASASCGGNGFTSCKTLTIQSGQITGTLTNFTMLVSDTDTTLKSTGNGGTVTDAQGDDIVFTSDSGCTTLLSWDPLDSWSSSTGAIITYVKVASIAVGTKIYRCSGKSAITTFQGGSTGSAWDSNFKSVLHLPNGTSLTALDSTSNATNGTITGAVAGSGQIDGAASFSSSGDQISLGTALNASGMPFNVSTSPFTISFWLKLSGSGLEQIFGDDSATASRTIDYNNSGCAGTNALGLVDGNNACIAQAAYSANLGTWHHLAWTYDGTSAHVLYIDGVSAATGSHLMNAGYAGNTILAGTFSSNQTVGLEDEVRVSGVVRSAAWIAAEFNNENSPSEFYFVS